MLNIVFNYLNYTTSNITLVPIYIHSFSVHRKVCTIKLSMFLSIEQLKDYCPPKTRYGRDKIPTAVYPSGLVCALICSVLSRFDKTYI